MLNWTLHEAKKTLIEIITELTSSSRNKDYTISMDRYYTTIDMVYYMNNNGFKVYGAI